METKEKVKKSRNLLETEEELRLAYIKLKELDNLKSNFLLNVAHELKTPLTSILLQTNMLEEGNMGRLSDSQKESVKLISRNMKNLNRLIGDILDVSLMQSEKVKIDFKRNNVRKVILDALEIIKPLALEKNIKIRKVIPKIPLAEFDFIRISQVLKNLIGNSVKFTPEGGKIWISVKKENEKIIFSIKDNGVGISKENQSKIFKRFIQVNSSYEIAERGLGLGLVISKEIIFRHKGKIWVESEEGKGSNFYFSIPITHHI